MENIVLTIGGLLKNLNINDLFFFTSSLVVILLLVYIIYLVRTDDENEVIKMKEEETKEHKITNNTIEEIVNNLENSYEPKPIDLSKYEQEMEDTAIISYDELVSRASNDIAYEDDYKSGLGDDIIVKKVDSTNTSNTREYVDLPKAVMMKYEQEEAFLDALKTLQKNLVR